MSHLAERQEADRLLKAAGYGATGVGFWSRHPHGLASGRLRAHIRGMWRSIAIVVAGGVIALAILISNHWMIIPGGSNSIAATIRLNRWTGAIEVCSLNAKTPTGTNASGLELTCEVQRP